MNLLHRGINCPRGGPLSHVEITITKGIIQELVKVKVALMAREVKKQWDGRESVGVVDNHQGF